MKLNINEKKALYAFGCQNHEATVDRLHMIAAITPDYEAKKFFFNLAIKLSVDASDEWYRCFFVTLCEEMAGYFNAELTMRLAEVSTYDMEDDYGEVDEV